jgi:hypothetical protein
MRCMSSKSTFLAIIASSSGLFAFLWSAYATLCLFAFSESFSSISVNLTSMDLAKSAIYRDDDGPPPILAKD